MKVDVTIVGEHRGEAIGWPSAWPPPLEGQEVVLGNGDIVYVRTVVWYPMGDINAVDDLDPFVYIVLGERSPT